MLFSALRCLLIELNAGSWSASPPRQTLLDELADAASDIPVILKSYPVPEELQRRLKVLLEVRHEIIHAAHQPGPEVSGTPAYLQSIREAGLLQSTGREADFAWISQLQSHRLFRWAFDVVRDTVAVLLREHQVSPLIATGLTATYSRCVPREAPKS